MRKNNIYIRPIGEYKLCKYKIDNQSTYFIRFKMIRVNNTVEKRGAHVSIINKLLKDSFKKYFKEQKTRKQENKFKFRIYYHLFQKIKTKVNNEIKINYIDKKTTGQAFTNINNIKFPDSFIQYGFDMVDDIGIYKYDNLNYNLEGGTDDKNDCLYRSLKKGTFNNLINVYPSTFKKWLKIKRNDKIKIDDIGILEDKLKMNINIMDKKGEYIRKTEKYNITKHIIYDEEKQHFKYKANPFNKKTLLTIPYKTKLIFFQRKEGKIITYDGINLNYDDKINHNSKDTVYKKYDGLENIEEGFNEYMNNINILRKRSGIDLTLYRYSVNKYIKKELYLSGLNNVEFKPIEKLEEKILTSSNMSGFLYYDKSKGNMKVYDINSFYSSLLLDPHFLIPTGDPEYHKLTQKELIEMKFIQYGYYRCNIDIKNPKLIMLSDRLWKSYYELKRARELNYKIEMIEDNDYNFMSYSSSNRINSHIIFKKFIDKHYPYKQQYKNESYLFKSILNNAHGALCERQATYINTEEHDNLNVQDEYILNMFPDDAGNHHIKLGDKNYYMYPYGRIFSFLISYSRYQLSRLIEKYEKDIHRIHTDGFYINSEIDIPINDLIGGLKIEKEGYFFINGVNDIIKK